MPVYIMIMYYKIVDLRLTHVPHHSHIKQAKCLKSLYTELKTLIQTLNSSLGLNWWVFFYKGQQKHRILPSKGV